MTEQITNGSIALIIITFLYFIIEASKLLRISTKLKEVTNSSDILNAFINTKFKHLNTSYQKSINISIDNIKKTNIPASEYFSELNICKTYKLNMKMLDIASSTLTGLGLLGTFLGLTMGIDGFDTSDTEKIKGSINILLSGMGTAFLTSLAGMSLSIIYSIIEKSWRNNFSKQLYLLHEKLDDTYYIDDITLQDYNQKQLTTSIYKNLEESINQQIKSVVEVLNSKLSYINEQGENVKIANAIREILTENTKQSSALQSFSTSLAEELTNLADGFKTSFDESLSHQMRENILPLIENIDQTTTSIVEHIDLMADQVSSPATDMIENVVTELKNSMSSIVDEFKTGLSGSATQELEDLALQLGSATQAMANFPKNMESISATLEVTIEEVKNAIAEISNTSANANSTAMQQMQEQISFATGAISNSITEVKEIMNGLTQNSQQQNDQMVQQLAEATEKMGIFLNGTISSLSTSVQESVKNITDDVNNKQADLIALQEDTTIQTRKLLETFNLGLERLEKMNEYISGTMNMFQQAQGQITGSTAHLQTITSDMKLATQLFNKGQADYTQKIEEIQSNNQRGIESVTQLLKNTGEMSEDYIEKFEIIKQGLGGIFGQIQNGLTEYSKTVQATTQKYLEQYSTNLTNTTDALSSTIEQQREIVEMLVDTLSSKTHK